MMMCSWWEDVLSARWDRCDVPAIWYIIIGAKDVALTPLFDTSRCDDANPNHKAANSPSPTRVGMWTYTPNNYEATQINNYK